MPKITEKKRTHIIKQQKKLKYDYPFREFKLGKFLIWLIPIYPICSFIPNNIFINNTNKFIIGVILIIILGVIYLQNNKHTILPAYKESNNFIGVYNTAMLKSKDKLIIRADEIEYIDALINDLFMKKSQNKFICVVGESGCGKSTIINILKDKISNKFNFID